MSMVHTELTKAHGSLSWLVIFTLPILSVLSGSIGTLTTGSELDGGWDTLWIRSIGFYGMTILPVGIAILASLAWKTEHTPGNWNALMSQPVHMLRIVASKASVVAIFAALMQVVLVSTIVVIGKLGLGLDGMLPATYWMSSLLVIIACIPVAALQSLLSMTISSFAIPVAIDLVATGMSTAALMVGVPGALLSPYALATYATQLGTTLVGDASTAFQAADITTTTGGMVVMLATGLSVFFVWLSTELLHRRDLHA